MKPIEVEYLFDGEKVVFYFVAEERVDFRELVKDLATRFRARIDMRQVGVRDEARIVGGLGHCGEQLCCVRFGGEFQPVSIRMAKEQDLPLNPLKISGLCGRLMCCLRYEYEAYKDYKGRAPKKGAIVETPLGLAKVAELNTPHETVGLRFEDGRRVSVPLAEMSCNKGTGCPCQVSREALEAVGQHGDGTGLRGAGSRDRGGGQPAACREAPRAAARAFGAARAAQVAVAFGREARSDGERDGGRRARAKRAGSQGRRRRPEASPSWRWAWRRRGCSGDAGTVDRRRNDRG